jgi:hypothetical protein
MSSSRAVLSEIAEGGWPDDMVKSTHDRKAGRGCLRAFPRQRCAQSCALLFSSCNHTSLTTPPSQNHSYRQQSKVGPSEPAEARTREGGQGGQPYRMRGVTSDISHFWCVCWLKCEDGEEMLLQIAVGVTKLGWNHEMKMMRLSVSGTAVGGVVGGSCWC